MILICNHMVMEILKVHNLFFEVSDKITKELKKAIDAGGTQNSIAIKCNTSQQQINRLLSGKRGSNLSLNIALKIWQGLGHPPETLIADCNVEPLLAAKIKRIQASDYARVLDLFAEVFANWEHASPTELAKVEAYLEMIRDRIIETKDRQEAGPGAKLSNSSGK